MKDGFPVSIAELLAAGQRPLPGEAVAIVLDVCHQVLRQPAGASVLPAIAPGALFVDASGTVAVAGGVPVEDDQTVPLLGRLLLQMLPSAGSPGAGRVPARLRALATRAATGGTPRLSVGHLAAGLRRFGPEQPQAAIRRLFERWRTADRKPEDGVARQAPPATTERRVAGPGPDVSRRWLREADEDAYFATLQANSDEADGAAPPLAESLEQAADAQVSRGTRSHAVVRGRRRRMARIGIVVVFLLVLMGMSAAYWLDADDTLPPLPMSPGILIYEPPAPPRGVWELLPDPAGLAADTEPAPPAVANGRPEARKSAGSGRRPAGNSATGKGRAQLDSPFAHRPDQLP